MEVPAQDASMMSRRHAEKISVVVFLSVDCPISQKYMGVLNDFAKQYSSQLSIEGVIPGTVSKKALREFKKEYQPAFPLNTDPTYTRAVDLKAGITPEAFLFDRQGTLQYQGAIDNWFYDLGSYRQQTTENYLKDAIDAILKDATPTVRKTNAVGCIIQKPKKK